MDVEPTARMTPFRVETHHSLSEASQRKDLTTCYQIRRERKHSSCKCAIIPMLQIVPRSSQSQGTEALGRDQRRRQRGSQFRLTSGRANSARLGYSPIDDMA